MRKFVVFFLLTWALMMVPISGSALDIISDEEMDAITGQKGVEIQVIDLSLDLDIQNIAWGDNDCGTLVVSTGAYAYRAGYVNINDFRVKNLYLDMDTDASGFVADASGTHLANAAHPLTLDVMTFSSNGPHCPMQALRGRTGIVVGVPDMYIAAEEDHYVFIPPVALERFVTLVSTNPIGILLAINGNLYLDDKPSSSETTTYNSNQKWDYTRTVVKSKKLWEMLFSGVEVTFHAYVGGYEASNLTPGGTIRPLNPRHRAQYVISAH